jgi:hypothetical protein
MSASFRCLALTALVAVGACSREPIVPARDAGVNRVFATVRGVT